MKHRFIDLLGQWWWRWFGDAEYVLMVQNACTLPQVPLAIGKDDTTTTRLSSMTKEKKPFVRLLCEIRTNRLVFCVSGCNVVVVVVGSLLACFRSLWLVSYASFRTNINGA